jgi:hypothetical protein
MNEEQEPLFTIESGPSGVVLPPSDPGMQAARAFMPRAVIGSGPVHFDTILPLGPSTLMVAVPLISRPSPFCFCVIELAGNT